jgi:predicted DNA-binding ribbon-helix-helix protein
MPVRQGGKYYTQILLDVNRYKLMEKIAEQEGMKTTALIRQFAYEGLKRKANASEYNAAEAADNAAWSASVMRRVQGRLRSKGIPC